MMMVTAGRGERLRLFDLFFLKKKMKKNLKKKIDFVLVLKKGLREGSERLQIVLCMWLMGKGLGYNLLKEERPHESGHDER